jgi:hypothetical protein
MRLSYSLSISLIFLALCLSKTIHAVSAFRNGISVIMVNHFRPQNFPRQLPVLNVMSVVNDIIVIHTNRETYQQWNYSKVTNIMAFFYADAYGPAQRYFYSSMAQTETILFLDDDNQYTEEYINLVYSAMITLPLIPRAAGSPRRSCSTLGYKGWRLPEGFIPLRQRRSRSDAKDGKNASNYSSTTISPDLSNRTTFSSSQDPSMIILTHFLMTQKSVMSDYLKFGFPVWQEVLRNNHGNCEDLSLNIFVKRFYSLSELIHVPVIKGEVRTLDASSGMQKRKSHITNRAAFCKTYSNTKFNKTNETPIAGGQKEFRH